MIGLWHCKDCQHEWEGAGGRCGLCGGDKYLLAEVDHRGRLVKWHNEAPRWGKTLGQIQKARATAKRDHIAIYTDGSCEPNPGPGAYAAYIEWMDGQITELDGFAAATTNLRMELMAPIVALEHIKKQRGQIIVFSDAKYVVNGATDWVET